MPVAQVIQFAERRTTSRRPAPAAQMGVILRFPRRDADSAHASVRSVATVGQHIADEDRVAGRGRDPG